MSKSTTFNPLAVTIDTIINYGTPDGAGIVRFDLWKDKYAAAGLDGAAVLANVWQSTLYKHGVHNAATAETLLGAKACEIAIRYGFIRGERVDRTGVQHTPECKIMWILKSEEDKKPGAFLAAERGEYGWLRYRLIGAVKQVKEVYGEWILTSTGADMMSILDSFPEAKVYWNFKGTVVVNTPDGEVEMTAAAAKMWYLRNLRGALKRIADNIDVLTPMGEICSCGRTHGNPMSSTVEAPPIVEDMSAPDDVPVSDVQAKLLRDAENLIADLIAELMDDNGKVAQATLRKRLHAKRGQANQDAAIQFVLNRGTVANF